MKKNLFQSVNAVSLVVFLLTLSPATAWLPTVRHWKKGFVTRWADTKTDKDTSLEMNDGSPCWEDLYEDDCVMNHAAAAHFVAADWIKSMPCGHDLEDCDMPDDLTAPEPRPEAGIDHVDILKMLHIKRAKPVQ